MEEKEKRISDKQEFCCDCEVFKNYEAKEKNFVEGFFCVLKDAYTLRDNIACPWIVSDKLPF